MIIYGTRSTEIAIEKFADKCMNCASQGGIIMSVYQRYVHVFWIPLFPIGKSGVTQCSNCKQILQKKEFDENWMRRYKTLKANSKTPIWTFAGVLIFIGLLAWGFFLENKNDTKNTQLILAPQKGDVYEIRNNYNSYTLSKVENVVEDEVFLLFSEYETNKMSGLNDLKNKGDSTFVEPVFSITKSELKDKFDKGEIININRR